MHSQHIPMATSALLSPTESLALPRSLLCWSTSQQAAIHATLQQLLADWQADWGLMPQKVNSTTAQNLSDAEARQILQDQLFDPPPPGISPRSAADAAPSMSDVLTDEAWNDWTTRLKRLLQVEQGHETDGPAELVTGEQVTSAPAWSGSIDITFPWWGGHWQLQLDAASVQRVLTKISADVPQPLQIPQGALVSATTALAAQPLKVTAEFSPITLTLGQIQSLRIGDVLPLQQRLDEPATLLLQTDTAYTVCSAWLGQSNGHMAAELSARSFSPQ